MSIETGVQNKLICIAVVSIVFHGLDREKALAIPIVYAASALCIVLIWALVAWKIGWTHLDKDLNLMQAYLEILSLIEKGKGDDAQDETTLEVNVSSVVIHSSEGDSGSIKPG